MALNISEFKGNFTSGARPNIYAVTISKLGPRVEFLAKAASLPASTIAPIEVPYRGRQLKVAGNRTFADWTVTVLNDVDFKIRELVESWMSEINGNVSNEGHVSIAEYMEDATVRQLAQDGSTIYTYEFKDIWPTEVGEIELAYDNNDAIEEFVITFAIGSYFTSNGAT